MEFHQQNVPQEQVKILITIEGPFEHDPSMTRNRPAIVVPESLNFQVRKYILYGTSQHFVHPLSFKNAFCARRPSKMHVDDLQSEAILRDFLKKYT